MPAPWPRATSWSANATASIATVAPIIGHGRACLDRCRCSATAGADEPFIGGTAPDWSRATSPARSAIGRVPATAAGSSRGARCDRSGGRGRARSRRCARDPVSDTVWKRSGPRTPIDQASSGSFPDGRVATTSPGRTTCSRWRSARSGPERVSTTLMAAGTAAIAIATTTTAATTRARCAIAPTRKPIARSGPQAAKVSVRSSSTGATVPVAAASSAGTSAQQTRTRPSCRSRRQTTTPPATTATRTMTCSCGSYATSRA